MRLNNSHVINELYQFNYKDINMHALDLDLTSFFNSLESWDDIFYYDNNLYILDFYTTGVNYKVNLETKEIVQLTYTFDSDVLLNGYYDWISSTCGNHILIIESPDYVAYNVHLLTLGEDIIDTPISIISDKGYDIYDIHPDIITTDVYNDDILYFSCMTDAEGKLNDIIYKLDIKKGTIESMNINIEEEAKDLPGTFEFAYISHGRLKVVFRIDKYFVFYEYAEALNRFNEVDRIIATYIGYGFTYFINNHIILNYRLNEYIGILVYDLHTHDKYLTPRMANSLRDVWIIGEDIMADNNNDGHMYRLEKCDKVALDKKADKSELFSGDYNDLTNKPEIPSVEGLASESYVNNAVAGIVDSSPETLNTLNELAQALGDDANFATTVSNQLGQKADKSELFSGSYNDLTNKPVIPSIQGLASESYVNQQISKIQHPTYDDTGIKNQLANKADKSELFSGDYNDLTNKPSIPSIAGLATENFVTNKIAEAQLKIEGDVIIDLQGYATKDELNLKADKTEIPNIEGLASESYVQQEIAKVQTGGDSSSDGYVAEDNVSDVEKEYVDDMFYSALGGLKFVKITQERYDALTNKDPNTIYIVVSAENMNNSTGEEGVSDIYNLSWTEGVNLSDTGSLVTNDSQASYRTSDFIKVNPEYSYKVNTSSSSQFQVFYYNKDKKYIGKSTIRNDKTEFAIYGYEGFAEAPEDVKYFRIRTSNKTSSIEINELGKREDMPVAFQFRNGYTVASNGSVSAASGYMVSGDIKLEPDYDYSITFNGNKTRVVFFNTDGNKTGNCLPSDSTYYNETTTLTRSHIPEAAVSFRMRFATGGEVNMNNINEHLKIVKTPKASKYIEPISSWVQSKGFDENGEEIDDIAAMSTGYVTITSGYDYMYTLKKGVPFGFQILYYDSNKAYISRSEVQNDPIGNKRFEIPSNAAYFRLKVSQENSLTFDNVNDNVEIKKMPAEEGMLYSFGVLSDVHVDAGSDGNFYDTNHATNDYRKAVKFLEDEGAEFIAYGGDMATGDPGVSEQDYRKVLDILKNSYIPNYMISGNHDYGYFFKALIESRKYYTVEKENDIFIFVNVQDRGNTGGVDREIIDAVRNIIEANPNKRLFLFYHYFIRNHGSGDGLPDVKYYTGDTCGDNYEDYPLSLEWANLIINTPNLIFCHGHSHFRFKCREVYEFNNYYHADGECHSVHIPSCAVPREMSADSTTVNNMPEGSEGYMVKVFADRVEFHAVQLTAYRYLTTYNFTVNLPQGN